MHLCTDCPRLLKASWAAPGTERGRLDDPGTSPYAVPANFSLARLPDGSYSAEEPPVPRGTSTDKSARVFEFTLTPAPGTTGTTRGGAPPPPDAPLPDASFVFKGPTGPDIFRYMARVPDVPAGGCWYCADKVYVRFFDMLTYPRPPRKFTVLLCRDDRVRALKQVLAAEVGVSGAEHLQLLLRGKPLDEDDVAMAVRVCGGGGVPRG